MKNAVDIIESERTNLRELFKGPYCRSDNKNVVKLVLRCAELYLEKGFWYDLCHAEIRLVEAGLSDLLDQIRDCFHESGLTNRYYIKSPMIDLTLARLDMMQFFEEKQAELFKGLDEPNPDPLSQFTINEPIILSDADRFNKAKIPDYLEHPDQLVVQDERYLSVREDVVWTSLNDLRFIGSLFSIVWDVVFVAISINDLRKSQEEYPYVLMLSSGYGLSMLFFELLSCRIFLISCCRPSTHIDCIYPGIDLYFIQYIASIIAGVILLIPMFISKKFTSANSILIIQHFVSLFVPFFVSCCLFRWHQRVDRKFKWINLEFRNSCWWLIVRIIICVLFTPSVNGVQALICLALRTKAKSAFSRKTKQLGAKV